MHELESKSSGLSFIFLFLHKIKESKLKKNTFQDFNRVIFKKLEFK